MELPRLEPLWQKYKDQGLTVIAIESQQDREGALEFIAEHGLTYPMVEDLVRSVVGYLVDEVAITRFGDLDGDGLIAKKQDVKLE